uniref:Uncharacterized protein n=1 Tax=Equus asinus asinus TaxID=83772 RepID=A0A8C4M4J8_EQUAS
MSVSGLSPTRPLGSVPGLLQVASQLCLVLLMVKAAQLYLRRQWLLKAIQEFPCPPSHWLYGHSQEFQKGDELQQIMKRVEKFPCACPRWLWGTEVLFVVYDPDYMKVILGRSDLKVLAAYRFLSPWIGYGLLLLNGQTWFQHGRMLTPAFHYNILKPYVGLMADSVQVMLVSQSLSPSQAHTQHNSQSPLQTQVSLRPSDQAEEGSTAEGGRAGEGHEEEALGFPGHPPLCQKAPGLPRPCLPSGWASEALRLYPPVPGIGREPSKPITFPDGRSLSKGIMVMLSFYALHHNLKVWPNPEVFDPSWFAPDSTRHSHAFLPFSGGSR